MSETAKHVSVSGLAGDLSESQEENRELRPDEPDEICSSADSPDAVLDQGDEKAGSPGFAYEYEIDADALLADLASLKNTTDYDNLAPPQQMASALSGEVSTQESRMKQLEEENRRLRLKLERQQQEFENMRLRYKRLQESDRQQMQGELMRQVLPLMDNFERAMEHATAGDVNEDFVTGVVLLYKQLSDLLEQNQVIPIMAAGQVFNPEFHEAVMVEPTSRYEANTVITEFEKGYTIETRLLRPARVKVAGRPKDETGEKDKDD
jgi:molecular chaperone GrpE